MDAARSRHLHQWTMTTILRADDHAIGFGFKQSFVSGKETRFILIRQDLSASCVIICNAEQFDAVHAAQVGDVGFTVMMGKRKNTNFHLTPPPTESTAQID